MVELVYFIRNSKKRDSILYLKVNNGETQLFNLSCKLKVYKSNFKKEKQSFKNDDEGNKLINRINQVFNNSRNEVNLKEELKNVIDISTKKIDKKDLFEEYRNENHIKLFKKFLSTNSFREINEFSLINFYNYLLENNKFKNTTAITYTKKVGTLVKKFYNKNGISLNLRPPKYKKVIDDKIYLNGIEINQLCNYNDERFINLVRIAYFTGARFGDWSKLKPSNFKDSILSFYTDKTNVLVKLPLTKEIEDIFKKYDYDIYGLNIKLDYFNYNLNKACKLVGLDEEIEVSIDGTKQLINKNELVTSHTLRRSRITNLALNGIDVYTIKMVSGHKTVQMVERYIKAGAIDFVDKLSGIL